VVDVSVHVRHGVDSESHVESKFMGVTRGRLDTRAGGDACDHDLRDAELPEMSFEVGVGESAPGPLGDDVIAWPLVQFGDQICPPSGKFGDATGLLGSASWQAVDIDEDNWQAVAAKGMGQPGGVLHHIGHWMGRRHVDDALLQVDYEQRRLGVEHTYRHVLISPLES